MRIKSACYQRLIVIIKSGRSFTWKHLVMNTHGLMQEQQTAFMKLPVKLEMPKEVES